MEDNLGPETHLFDEQDLFFDEVEPLPSIDFPTEPLPSLEDVLKSPEALQAAYHRRFTLLTIVSFAFVIFPVWWQTTQVYRATLPFNRIDNLASNSYGSSLLAELQIPYLFSLSLYEYDIKPNDNHHINVNDTPIPLSLKQEAAFLQDTLNVNIEDDTSTNEDINNNPFYRFNFIVKPNNSTENEKKDLNKLLKLWNQNHNDNSKWNQDTQLFAKEFIKKGYLNSNFTNVNGHYELHVNCPKISGNNNNGNAIDSVFISQSRAIFLKSNHNCQSPRLRFQIRKLLFSIFDEERSDLNLIISRELTRRENLNNSTNSSSNINDDTLISVPFNNEYQITFSLLNGDPSNLIVDWEIESSLKKYIQPFVDNLNSLHNITISAQILNYASLTIDLGSIYIEFPDENEEYSEINTETATEEIKEPYYTRILLDKAQNTYAPSDMQEEFDISVKTFVDENVNNYESLLDVRNTAEEKYLPSGFIIAEEERFNTVVNTVYKDVIVNKTRPKRYVKHIIPYNLLGNFINSAEWTLASVVSTAPPLNFILYVPEEQYSPLYVVKENNEILNTNSFLLPQWGGVVVSNEPFYGKHRLLEIDNEELLKIHNSMHTTTVGDNNIDVFKYNKKLLKPTLEKFLSQLRDLLGIKSLKPSKKYLKSNNIPIKAENGKMEYVLTTNNMNFNIEFARKVGVTTWELDSLVRRRIIENIIESIHTLRSLTSLVRSLENIVILDSVAEDVNKAVESIELSIQALIDGDIDKSRINSVNAFYYSDKAYFDPTMVGMLYFPDEHKYAVYMPLFIPVSVALLFSILKEIKSFILEKRKKRNKHKNKNKIKK